VDQGAYDAVEQAWRAFIKVRALCPSANEAAIGSSSYVSPGWYRARGVTYFVQPERPMTHQDFLELKQMTSFVNRSFVVAMAAIIEAYGVVPYGAEPDPALEDAEYVRLTKWLRNRFAHGEIDLDPQNPRHVETRQLLEKLLPEGAAAGEGFPASIDTVLEPLKDGVLRYVWAAERSV